jgi:hypothetical protein
MATLARFGAIYTSHPPNRPNQPVEAKPVNPLPDNKKTLESGNAGLDGYSVLSRASRYDGSRFIAGTEPEYFGPNLDED